MAKLFKLSAIIFVLVGFLALAKAEPKPKHDEHHTKVKVEGPGNDNGENGDEGGKGGILAGGGSGAAVAIGPDGNPCDCKCKDSKLKEFAHKVSLLLRTYTSNELGPELQRVGKKFVEYVMTYLAKEKPAQMDKFQNFLQSSATVTGNVITKSRS